LVDDSSTSPYDSLDPATGFFPGDGYFANVFQGLVQYNGSDSNHVVPSIARNWTVSNNYENYTFTIRPDVWFSNGDPVNAYVAWFSFVRGLFMNAPAGTYVSNYFDLLYNSSLPCTGLCVSQEGNNHSANVFPWGLRLAISHVYGIPLTDENALVTRLRSVLSNFTLSDVNETALMSYPNQAIVAMNYSTLRFNLLEPYDMFLLDLPPQWGAIVDPQWIDKAANCGGVANNTICSNFGVNGGPGTGPYEFDTVMPDQIVLTANPSYWATLLSESQLCSQPGETVCAPVLEAPHIRTIFMYFGTAEDQVASNFDSNNAQLAFVGVDQFGRLLGNYSYEGYGFNQLFHGLGYPLGDFGIGLNGVVFPTNITDFRLAVVHAVNYTAFLSPSYTYQGVPLAELFQPPAPPGWGPLDNPGNISLYSYNLTLAAQLLNRSGWEGDFYTFTNAAIGHLPAGAILGNPRGLGLPHIVDWYTVPLTPGLVAEHQVISNGLSKIGVQVDFQGLTNFCPAGCSAPNYENEPPMLDVGWYANWPDPVFQQFIPMAIPGVAFQLSASVTNSTLSALLYKIAFETNPTQQAVDSAKAWAMYTQLAGMIQLPLPENYVFAQPYLQGIIYNPFQYAYYYNMMYYQTT